MHRYKHLILLILVTFFLFSPSFVYANSIAKVIAITGDVTLERADSKTKITLKDDIFLHDIIHTSSDGKVQLFFNDDSIINIGSNTHYTIEAFSDKGNTSFASRVSSGFVRFATGKIVESNPEAFKVRTPEATVGIRGTTFSVLRQNGVTQVATENSLNQQSVVVGNTIIPPGQIASFGIDETLLSPPIPMTLIQRQNLVNQSSISSALDDFDDLDDDFDDLDDLDDFDDSNDLDDLNENFESSNPNNLNGNFGGGFGDDDDSPFGDDRFDDDFDNDNLLNDDLDDDDDFSSILNADALARYDSDFETEGLGTIEPLQEISAVGTGDFSFNDQQGRPHSGVFEFQANLTKGLISNANFDTTSLSAYDFNVINGTGTIESDEFEISGGTATLNGSPVNSWEAEGSKLTVGNTFNGNLDFEDQFGLGYNGTLTGDPLQRK